MVMMDEQQKVIKALIDLKQTNKVDMNLLTQKLQKTLSSHVSEFLNILLDIR